MSRMRSVKSLILLFAIIYSAESLCGLGEFDCKGKCIERERQCDGHDDCEDGSDEAHCSFIEGCQPAELSCVAMANDVETEKCYNTTTDICIAGGFNALCVNHTDVQNCRCNTNDYLTMPMRCPVDGMCYKATTLEEFCGSCEDPVICPKNGTDVKCEGDYFSCPPISKTFSDKDSVCLPMAARCDHIKQCDNSLRNYDDTCDEPTISLQTPENLNPYIGEEVEIKYKVSGSPKPKFLLYHYNKKIPFEDDGTFSYENTTIAMSDKQTNVIEYEYKIVITNVNEYFYGPFQAIVWSVGDDPIKLNDGGDGSFHYRILAEEVNVEFQGAPTVMMKGLDTDRTDLTEQIDYTWTSGDLLNLICVSTGSPEPEIHFMIDGDYLWYEEGMMNYTISQEWDEATMSLEATLTLIKGNPASTPGVYSCQAENVLGIAKSDGSINLDLVISPEITEFNGMEDGYFFFESDTSVQITCKSTGYPDMWNKLYVDGVEIPAENVDQVVTETTATIQYTHTSSANATIKCTAKNDPSADDVDEETVSETVEFYPVVSPTITLDQEKFELTYGDDFSTNIRVVFTESLKEDQERISVSVTKEDGTALDDTIWDLTSSLDEYTWEGTLSSIEAVSIANIATVKVEASDEIYTVEDTMIIDVIVPARFTKELESAMTVNKGHTITVEVAVLSKPATQTAQWQLKDEDLVDNGDDVIIAESFDGATYITTYSLTLNNISESQAGDISVVITPEEGNSLTSVMTLTVVDHPCLLDPQPCQNGAQCVPGEGIKYTCKCLDFYEGVHCETNTICDGDNNPCENDSTCVTTEYNDPETPVYKCDCLFEFEGRNCSDQINFCEREGGGNELCDTPSGNAICINTWVEPNGFDCFCKHNKGGVLCNMEQLCTPNTCKNDGTCTVVGYGEDRTRECLCKDGYQGELCEEMIPGHCWIDCNDRAYCEDNKCLCDYAYYGDSCEKHISDTDVNIKIPPKAYLLAHTYPIIPDERIQKYVLPVKIEPATTSCRIARIMASQDGSGGHLDFGVSVTEVEETTSVTMVISGMIGEVAVSQTLDQVVVTSVESITLLTMMGTNKYAVVSVGHADGTIVAIEIKLVIPELPYLKLGDLEAGVGCDMALIGHVTAGPYTLVHAAAYSEGRSVYPLDACFHDPCLNGGVCAAGDLNEQICNCTGTGFTGDFCEVPAEDSCDKGCLNGGSCHDGYCVCPLSFHGVLCEATHEVTGTMRLSGDVSHAMFTHSNISKLEVHATGLAEAEIKSNSYLLAIGEEDNSVKILVTETKTLYMLVVRGKERGAYEGLGTLADYMDGETMKIVVSLGEEIMISKPAGDKVTFTADELPCTDGYGPFSGLALHGLSGITSEVTALINDEEVMVVSGMGLVNSDVDAELCAGACGEGTCTQLNNQITCSDCPEGTNSVTCSDHVCDETACQGHCADVGECVCEIGRAGENCETEVSFGSSSMPVTTSSHYSYLKYYVESMMDMAVQVSFRAHLEDTEQSGLLAYVGNTNQHISLTLEKTALHVVVHCSETIHEEAILEGVVYGEWLDISFSWADNFLTLSMMGIDDVQVETGMCWFNMGTNLYLGGMPDGSVGSVKATFGPADFIMPLGATLVGGQSIGVSETHICDTDFNRCSQFGTESCDKVGDNYNCTCKEGWQGDHCEELIIITPCERHGPCSENEVCVEMGDKAACLCELPYTRNEEENLCEGQLGQNTGFCMESAMSYANIYTNQMKVMNNLDAMFRFYLSDNLTVNTTHDVASVVYLTDDGSSGYITLILNVTEETVQDGNDTLTNPVYNATIDVLDINQQLEPNQWHVIRIQTSGMGTTIDIDDKTFTTSAGAVLVSRLHLGTVENPAYMDCIGDIVINGEAITEIDDGVGVKSCSDKVPTEYEEIEGAVIWAKLGLL